MLQPEQIRTLWKDNGGNITVNHNPTASMPEKALFIFINELLKNKSKEK